MEVKREVSSEIEINLHIMKALILFSKFEHSAN
jgi:hypothetical protein